MCRKRATPAGSASAHKPTRGALPAGHIRGQCKEELRRSHEGAPGRQEEGLQDERQGCKQVQGPRVQGAVCENRVPSRAFRREPAVPQVPQRAAAGSPRRMFAACTAERCWYRVLTNLTALPRKPLSRTLQTITQASVAYLSTFFKTFLNTITAPCEKAVEASLLGWNLHTHSPTLPLSHTPTHSRTHSLIRRPRTSCKSVLGS